MGCRHLPTEWYAWHYYSDFWCCCFIYVLFFREIRLLTAKSCLDSKCLLIETSEFTQLQTNTSTLPISAMLEMRNNPALSGGLLQAPLILYGDICLTSHLVFHCINICTLGPVLYPQTADFNTFVSGSFLEMVGDKKKRLKHIACFHLLSPW